MAMPWLAGIWRILIQPPSWDQELRIPVASGALHRLQAVHRSWPLGVRVTGARGAGALAQFRSVQFSFGHLWSPPQVPWDREFAFR